MFPTAALLPGCLLWGQLLHKALLLTLPGSAPQPCLLLVGPRERMALPVQDLRLQGNSWAGGFAPCRVRGSPWLPSPAQLRCSRGWVQDLACQMSAQPGRASIHRECAMIAATLVSHAQQLSNCIGATTVNTQLQPLQTVCGAIVPVPSLGAPCSRWGTPEPSKQSSPCSDAECLLCGDML